MSNVINLHDHQSAIWEAYVEAQKRAQVSGSRPDILNARHAWAVWLSLHVSPDQRDASMRLAMEQL